MSANGQSRGWLNGDVVDAGVGVGVGVGTGAGDETLCDMTRQHNTSSCRTIRSSTFIVACDVDVQLTLKPVLII